MRPQRLIAAGAIVALLALGALLSAFQRKLPYKS
jgi:hypothetical protein